MCDYLFKVEDEISKALSVIQTIKLKKFKGKNTEMLLKQIVLAHSPELERMIVEQCNRSTSILVIYI